jgi:hypothetical protein
MHEANMHQHHANANAALWHFGISILIEIFEHATCNMHHAHCARYGYG